MRLPDKLTGPHVNERTDRPGTWRVRWRLNGAAHTRDFQDEETARDFTADIRRAARERVRFDRRTGLPATTSQSGVQLHEWVRTYLAERWDGLAQNTRRTDAWTLAYMVERATGPLNTTDRRALLDWLNEGKVLSPAMERWLRDVPALGELDRAALFSLETAMRLGVGGKELKGRPAARQVATMKRCLNEAVRRGLVTSLDWPPHVRPSRTKKSKVAARKTATARTVMSVADARALMGELGERYRLMTAFALFAGLRPAEVVALEGADVERAAKRTAVRKAWNGSGPEWGDASEDIGPTKTAVDRFVPFTDDLVALLPDELPDGPLFRTPSGARPSEANWRRALRGAAKRAGVAPVTPYECRHFFISHLVLRVPIAKAASIAGHSPETLVAYYLHDVEGDTPDLSALFE